MNFKKVIDLSPICTVVVDKDDNVIYHNNSFINIVGENIIGEKITKVFGWNILKYLDLSRIGDQVELEKTITDYYGIKKRIIVNAYVLDNMYVVFKCTDITKLDIYNRYIKKTLSQLEEDKRKAEISDKLKSSFLSHISHSIRTPLNSIIGFSRLLTNNYKGKNKKYARIIEENSISLTNIIDNIIDLSRIESNEVIIKNEKCNINDKINYLYDMFKDKVKDSVQLVISDNLPNVLIYTDDNRLNQIFINLILNSIKFTNNGYIRIGYKLGYEIIFYVEDTGIGIEKKYHEVIFEKFRQLDQRDSKRYYGTGLGLSITKQLIELLGGRIWLSSEIGKGTTFYFTIPSDYVQKISNQYKSINKKIDFNWKNKKFLIIEDDQYSSLLITEILKKTNCKYKIVNNGLESLELLDSKNDYDVIICDLKLPDIHGFELIKKLKIYNTPVIAYTSFFGTEIPSIIEMGFDDVVIKPFETKILLKKINKFL